MENVDEPTDRQMEVLHSIATRVSYPDLAKALSCRMGDLARALLGEPTQEGREEWRYRTKGSLSVEVGGPNRGSWYDHEAGVGGDALGLVGHVRRKRPEHAARWAQDWLGGAPVANVPQGDPEAAERPSKAPPP